MKKIVVILLFLLSIHLVSGIKITEKLPNDIVKETNAALTTYYKQLGKDKFKFKTILKGTTYDSITLTGGLNQKTTLYHPTLVQKVVPKEVKFIEDYDTAEILFYKTFNSKSGIEPLVKLSGEISSDISKKTVSGKAFNEKIKKTITTTIEFLQNGEVKVYENNKLYKQIFNDGTVQLLDNKKIITKYNMFKLAKVFPIIKHTPAEIQSSFGLGEKNTFIQKTNEPSFLGKSSGDLKIKHFIGLNKITRLNVIKTLYISGELNLDVNNQKILLKKLSDPVASIETLLVFPFSPSLSAEKLTIKILKNKDLYITTEKKGKLEINEYFLKKEKGKLVGYAETGKINEIVCSNNDCKLDYTIRFNEIDKGPVLDITGSAKMLAPKGKQIEIWKEDWKQYFKISERGGLGNIRDKLFKEIKFSDITIKDMSEISFKSSGLFLDFYGKPTKTTSNYAGINFDSKNKKVYMGTIATYTYGAVEDFAFLTPIIRSTDIIIKENKAGIIGLFNTGKGTIDYNENNQKLFTLVQNEIFIFNEKNKLAFEGLLDFYPAMFLNKDRITVSLNKRKVEEPKVIIKFYPKLNNQKYKSFIFNAIKKEDRDSRLIFENNFNSEERLVFQGDKLVLSPKLKWHNFGVNLEFYLFERENSRYAYLQCKYNEKKCYHNGIEVSTPTKAKLKLCVGGGKCPSGQICIGNGICVQNNKCKKLNIPGMNGPIKLHFINDGAFSKKEFKNVIEELIGTTERGGTPTTNILKVKKASERIFNKKPFKERKSKYSIYYTDDSTLPIRQDLTAAGIIKTYKNKNCPNANFPIALSRAYFGSYAVPAYTAGFSLSIVNGPISISKPQLLRSPNVLGHEMGHALFFLDEEYFLETKRDEYTNKYNAEKLKEIIQAANNKAKNSFDRSNTKYKWNCAIDKKDSITKGWPSGLYDKAAANWRGCGGGCVIGCGNWVKASKESIMSNGFKIDQFSPPVEQHILQITDQMT